MICFADDDEVEICDETKCQVVHCIFNDGIDEGGACRIDSDLITPGNEYTYKTQREVCEDKVAREGFNFVNEEAVKEWK